MLNPLHFSIHPFIHPSSSFHFSFSPTRKKFDFISKNLKKSRDFLCLSCLAFWISLLNVVVNVWSVVFKCCWKLFSFFTFHSSSIHIHSIHIHSFKNTSKNFLFFFWNKERLHLCEHLGVRSCSKVHRWCSECVLPPPPTTRTRSMFCPHRGLDLHSSLLSRASLKQLYLLKCLSKQ